MSEDLTTQAAYVTAAEKAALARVKATERAPAITIGLAGLAGSGKDTVADALVTHAGFTKLSFADALRLEVAAGYTLGGAAGLLNERATKELPHPALAFNCCKDAGFLRSMQAMHGGNIARRDMDAPRSPRQIMQLWGTEYRREQQPNYWSTLVAMQILAQRDLGRTRHVVSDCRFDNEAEAMRSLGGEVWQIFRPGLVAVEGNHASQNDGNSLMPVAVIVNNDTVPFLIDQVLRLLVKRHGGEVLPLYFEQEIAP